MDFINDDQKKNRACEQQEVNSIVIQNRWKLLIDFISCFSGGVAGNNETVQMSVLDKSGEEQMMMPL